MRPRRTRSSLVATVTVRRDEAYPILVEPGLAASLPDTLDRLRIPPRRLVVTSPRVWRHHGDRLASLTRAPMLVADGERAKTLRTAGALYTRLLDERVDRRTTIVVVGGGVLGDLVGFVSATLMRGLPLVQVPTTVVAQVDAAIGGKVGVNVSAGKNLVGAFYQPRAVLVDPIFLETLPAREFRAGLYEVIKYALIASQPLFDTLSGMEWAALPTHSDRLAAIVAACVRIKADVVTRDERDAGPRLALNFGHTIGHALETVTGYRVLRHGEAVGLGMIAAIHLSVARGLLSRAAADRMVNLVASPGQLPDVEGIPLDDIVDALWLDKKRTAGHRFTFVLSRGVGRVSIATDVEAREVRAACLAMRRSVGRGGARTPARLRGSGR